MRGYMNVAEKMGLEQSAIKCLLSIWFTSARKEKPDDQSAEEILSNVTPLGQENRITIMLPRVVRLIIIPLACLHTKGLSHQLHLSPILSIFFPPHRVVSIVFHQASNQANVQTIPGSRKGSDLRKKICPCPLLPFQGRGCSACEEWPNIYRLQYRKQFLWIDHLC